MPLIPVADMQHPLCPRLHAPSPPLPLPVVRIPQKVDRKGPDLHETDLGKEVFRISHGVLRHLRPQWQAVFLGNVPNVIDELVGDFRDFILKDVGVDGYGVDDQILFSFLLSLLLMLMWYLFTPHMPPLTLATVFPQLRDQRRPLHLIHMQRRLAPRSRPRLLAQQLPTGPHGRVAKLAAVVLLGRNEADGRPSDDGVGVVVPGQEDAGVSVVEVPPQHLDDDGPDAVARVEELGGRVVGEGFDEDVGQGADVVVVGVARVDEEFLQQREVDRVGGRRCCE